MENIQNFDFFDYAMKNKIKLFQFFPLLPFDVHQHFIMTLDLPRQHRSALFAHFNEKRRSSFLLAWHFLSVCLENNFNRNAKV